MALLFPLAFRLEHGSGGNVQARFNLDGANRVQYAAAVPRRVGLYTASPLRRANLQQCKALDVLASAPMRRAKVGPLLQGANGGICRRTSAACCWHQLCHYPAPMQDVAMHPSFRLLASALDDGDLLLHVYESPEGGSGSLQLWPGHSLRPFAGAAQPGCTVACFVSGSDSAAGGVAVAGSAAGALHAADVESGRQAWSHAGSGGTGAAGGHARRIKAAEPLDPHLLATGGGRIGKRRQCRLLCTSRSTPALHATCFMLHDACRSWNVPAQVLRERCCTARAACCLQVTAGGCSRYGTCGGRGQAPLWRRPAAASPTFAGWRSRFVGRCGLHCGPRSAAVRAAKLRAAGGQKIGVRVTCAA